LEKELVAKNVCVKMTAQNHIQSIFFVNQEEHHKKQTFKEEYIDFLHKFEIEFNEKYLFEWIE
jgi:putative transposase